jgi:hypothetical protein
VTEMFGPIGSSENEAQPHASGLRREHFTRGRGGQKLSVVSRPGTAEFEHQSSGWSTGPPRLPDGTGIDVMRHTAARHNLKGIALSGYGQDEELRRSREAGFVTHLTKPVNLQTLHDAIREATE